VEILVVVSIIGILATLAVSSFLDLSEKYKVEAETKQLYADLMDVRGRAVQRNRFHFVRFTLPNAYAT
jgi:Tfp pilus assembly protein FimT